MATIFISYNRQSEPIVKNLANDIESLGHTVWFDHELSGGQAWWEQILAKVRDCGVFVFVLSPAGLDSTACKREYTYAAELGKPVLPVLVSDDVSIPLLPPVLSKIELVDYRKQDRDAAFRLARAFTTVPPPEPLPDPLPKPPDAPISYLGGLTEQVDTHSTLSYQEQTALLVDLKRSLRDPENRDDARTLLQKLRKRRDLLATIAEDIDEALGSLSIDKPAPQNVSADPGPVSTSPDNVNEAATFLLSIGSVADGTRLRVNNATTPEPQEPESQIHKLTVKARLIGAGIGAAVGLVCGMLMRTAYPGWEEVVPLLALSGAIAGAISGTRLTRMLAAAVGMIAAMSYFIVVGYQDSPLPWLLVVLLAPPLGALVGQLIDKKKH